MFCHSCFASALLHLFPPFLSFATIIDAKRTKTTTTTRRRKTGKETPHTRSRATFSNCFNDSCTHAPLGSLGNSRHSFPLFRLRARSPPSWLRAQARDETLCSSERGRELVCGDSQPRGIDLPRFSFFPPSFLPVYLCFRRRLYVYAYMVCECVWLCELRFAFRS